MKSLAMIILNHYEQVFKSPRKTKMATKKEKTKKILLIFKPSVSNVINLNLILAYDYNRYGFFLWQVNLCPQPCIQVLKSP